MINRTKSHAHGPTQNQNQMNPFMRPKGSEFTPEVRRRIYELYKEGTFQDVAQTIAFEFPDRNYSLARIINLIHQRKQKLHDDIVECQIEGDLEDAEVIKEKIKDELLDKRSRLKRGLEKIIECNLNDLLAE